MPRKNNTPIDLQSLIDHMHEAVWIVDRKEQTIYANDKLSELIGHPLDKIIGRSSYDFCDTDSIQKIRKNTQSRKEGKSSTYEIMLIHKNGKKISVSITGTPLRDGCTMGIITDLSDIKKSEEKNALLSRVIEQSEEAVILLSHKEEVLYWNRGAEKVFGYTKHDTLSKNLFEVLFLGEKKFPLTDEHLHVELQAQHKRGGLVEVDLGISSQMQDGAKTYVLIARNIGPAKQMQRDLLLKYQKIQEAFNQFGILKRKNDYLIDLIRESQKQGQTIKTIADYIVASIIMFSRVDACLIRLCEKQELQMISGFGFNEGWLGKKSVSTIQTLAWRAFMKEERIVKILDINSSRDYSTKGLALKNNLRSLLLFPLVFRGKFFGSMSLYMRSSKDFELLEDDFITQYKEVVELVMGSLLTELGKLNSFSE